MRVTLSPETIAVSCADFGISLQSRQLEQISIYVDLLQRWNRVINLTAVREPREMIVRHFAESIYVTKSFELSGKLLDVGSGAGFPGLALKIAVPELDVVLLEPAAKKRAFLKEVVRECALGEVEVSGERVEAFCMARSGQFDSATIRAVGDFALVLPATARCLAESGTLYLWLTGGEAAAASAQTPDFNNLFEWSEPSRVPHSRDRQIWKGRLKPAP